MPPDVLLNPRHGVPGLVVLPAGGFRRAKAEITTWPGYTPTPLHALPGGLWIKDEGTRFGLGSFKALGGAYAVAGQLAAWLSRQGVAMNADGAALESGRFRDATSAVTMACASAGNHGRSVAWGARRFGCRCVVFVHAGVAQASVGAIEALGADVRRVAGSYDDSVREAARAAGAEGWIVISDTSGPGDTEIPRIVMQGYRLMADEAADQWTGSPPTHAFIQAGVGGVAAAVATQMRSRFHPAPRLIVVEPAGAACLLASARAGALTALDGALDTSMTVLACGTPSLLAWQELERAAFAFMTVDDAGAEAARRALAAHGLDAGLCGAAGYAGYLAAANDPAVRAALGLDPASRVLLFSTER